MDRTNCRVFINGAYVRDSDQTQLRLSDYPDFSSFVSGNSCVTAGARTLSSHPVPGGQSTSSSSYRCSNSAEGTLEVYNPSAYYEESMSQEGVPQRAEGDDGRLHGTPVESSFSESQRCHSVESISLPEIHSSDCDPATKRRAVSCVKKCCVFLFIAGVVAGIGFIVAVLEEDLFFAKASIEMRVKEPFEDALGNRSSPRAEQYCARVCQQVVDSLESSSQVQSVQNCTVGDISNGSVRFTVALQFYLKKNLTRSRLEEEVIATGTRIQRDGSFFLQFGDLLAYPADFRLTGYSVFREASEAPTRPAPTTTPSPGGEFDCSLPGSSHYKPYADTFPSKCAMYQRCQNGIGHHYNCSPGLEFAYIPDIGYGPCQLPSSATYCGKKRAELTTEDTTTSSTTAMTSSTANVTSPKTSVTTTQPSTTTDSCSSLEEVYSHNSDELYSCKYTVEQGFRASSDTFPNNCSAYVWCTNGAFFKTWACANGTDFVFGENGTLESCRNKGDPDTFCAKMNLAQNCP